MPYRHRSPDRGKLRSSHLLRLATVAEGVTDQQAPRHVGFKMSIRICRGAGSTFEDMAAVTDFTARQLEEWSED